jgi:hypothetical protein
MTRPKAERRQRKLGQQDGIALALRRRMHNGVCDQFFVLIRLSVMRQSAPRAIDCPAQDDNRFGIE